MSDTPIDQGLDERPSIRLPTFLDDRTEAFRDDYNELLEQTNLDDEAVEAFTLDSASDTYRRLVDIALAYYDANGIPFGFAFDPEMLSDDEEKTYLRCPSCANDDQAAFRVGASASDEGVVFDQVRCSECGDSHDPGDVFTVPPSPLLG